MLKTIHQTPYGFEDKTQIPKPDLQSLPQSDNTIQSPPSVPYLFPLLPSIWSSRTHDPQTYLPAFSKNLLAWNVYL